VNSRKAGKSRIRASALSNLRQIPVFCSVAIRRFVLRATLDPGEFGNFVEALLNTSSTQFSALAARVLPAIQDAFRGQRGFVSMRIVRFSRGSIVVWLVF